MWSPQCLGEEQFQDLKSSTQEIGSEMLRLAKNFEIGASLVLWPQYLQAPGEKALTHPKLAFG